MTKHVRLVLVVSILAAGISFLDGSIVNVALPAIMRELGGGLSTQQWVVDAYAITLGALMLVAGSLSDVFGRRKILAWGLVGFLVASLACALAPNATALVIARGLQGIAGALLVPSSLALIISACSGKEQAKAIGTWTAWTGVSFIIGPLLGGYLVDAISWRLIFGINVLPIVVTLVLLSRLKLANDEPKKTPVDVTGTVLCALGLGGPVFALIEQPYRGWHDPLIYAPLVLGSLLLAVFLGYEARAKHPMLPLSLFANRNFSAGNVATLFIYACLAVITFLLVVFLQQVGGYSAFKAGLALLPVTIIMFVLSPRFGALAGRFGPRLFMTFGPMIMATACLVLARLDASAGYAQQVLPGVLVFGLGLSVTVAPLTSAVLGSIHAEQAGIASAVNNAVSRVAGLLAVAAIGAFLSVQFTGHLQTGRYAPAAVTAQAKPLDISVPDSVLPAQRPAYKQAVTNASVDAFRTSMVVMAGGLLLGGVVSAIGIRNHITPKPRVQAAVQ